MDDLTNLGPLTTRFSPVGSGCSSSVLLIGTGTSIFTMYNTMETSSTYSFTIRTYGDITASGCYPPNYMTASEFQPELETLRYYSPGICPSGYDIAVTGEVIGNPATADAAKREAGGNSRATTTAICCPRGYSVGGIHLAETCQSQATLLGFTGKVYNIIETSHSVSSGCSITSTIAGPTVMSLYPGIDMDTTVSAAGIVIMRSEGDPEWHDEPRESSSSPNTLGQGAVAGIAVGAALGGLILLGSITAAIIIGRRRRKQAAAADQRTRSDSTYRKAIYPQAEELTNGQPVGSEVGIEGARVSPGTLVEVDGIRPPGELQTVERPVEVLCVGSGRVLELPA